MWVMKNKIVLRKLVSIFIISEIKLLIFYSFCLIFFLYTCSIFKYLRCIHSTKPCSTQYGLRNMVIPFFIFSIFVLKQDLSQLTFAVLSIFKNICRVITVCLLISWNIFLELGQLMHNTMWLVYNTEMIRLDIVSGC